MEAAARPGYIRRVSLREWWGLDGLEPTTSSPIRTAPLTRPQKLPCNRYVNIGPVRIGSFDQRRQIVGFWTVGTVGGNGGTLVRVERLP